MLHQLIIKKIISYQQFVKINLKRFAIRHLFNGLTNPLGVDKGETKPERLLTY
ncbi:hypothetical protein [Spirosoma arcticum]